MAKSLTPAAVDAAVFNFLGLLEAEQRAAEASTPDGAAGFNTTNRSGTSYHGAAIDAMTRNWIPKHRSGDDSLRDSYGLLTARIDDLIRNEPSLGQCERALVKHVVRTGIKTFAEVMNPDRSLVEDFNDECDEHFDHWAECEADVEGKQAWPDMQWHTMEQTVRRGDGLLLWCLDDDPSRTVPLCLQQLEAAQLDESKNEPAGAGGSSNRIVRGVELDKRNRAIAYWLFDAHPYDSSSGWSSKSTRIPAERVIHNFVPFTPSMTRGISWFHALIRVTRDVDWFLGSELTAAALGALLVMIHKQQKFGAGQTGMGLGDDGADSDTFGNALVKLGSGSTARIPVGDEIELVESKRPGRQVAPFMQLMRQEQAMGAGISYLTLTNDFSQTSFTSAHGAANEEWAYFQALQQRLGRRVVKPVRRKWTQFAAAYGLFDTLTATQFAQQPRKWSRVTLLPPGRDQLNPLDQSGASIEKMRSGLSNLMIEAGLLGFNWRHLVRGKAQVERYARDNGTTLDWTKGASNPAEKEAQRHREGEPAPAPVPDDEEDDD